tara:strand:+ start:206 stop:766 length:561 start_codon:yes stop_codon:yes gene_type:complete
LSVTYAEENCRLEFGVELDSTRGIIMKIVVPITAFYICILGFMGISNASAQLSVTALAGAPLYESPITENAMTAPQIRRGVRVQDMSIAEANNYCVSNLLGKKYHEALRACEAALIKVDDQEIRLGGRRRKEVKASILANLSVGELLSGDISAARRYADRASSLDSGDRSLRNIIRTLIARTKAFG